MTPANATVIARSSPKRKATTKEIAIVEPVRASANESESEPDRDRELDAAPARIESQESEAIRVGAPRTVADDVAEERAAMAAIVAEVAAVERFAAR